MDMKKKKKNHNPYFTTFIKINRKYIIDLNGERKTIRFLPQKKTGESICDLGLGIDFFRYNIKIFILKKIDKLRS